jgi:hypothetical protein
VPDPQTNTVLILDSFEKDYNPHEVWEHWRTPDRSTRCPACGGARCLHRHGRYLKYHFRDRIQIVRLRCLSCRRTHALIPSFSIPGLSIGSGEAERYLTSRESGVGRGRAAAELLARGMSERYMKHLEKMFATAIARAKALLAGFGDQRLRGLPWIRSVLGDVESPLVGLNRFCLTHGSNAVCFCRASILPCTRPVRSRASSHDGGSAAADTTAIASGP